MATFPVLPPVQFAIIALLCVLLMMTYLSCLSSTSSPSKVFPLSPKQLNISWIDDNCPSSLAESDGFFCELNTFWLERKHIYHTQDKLNMEKRPDYFYLASNWEPNFHCAYAQRMGTMGDGGKWVCDVFRLISRSDCLIYSVGSSGDFSFEIEMKKVVPNSEIHTFDKNRYPCPINTCTFHQIIFGDGIQPNGSKSWMTIVQELNHTNRIIDILKIDIEGAEYEFFPMLFNGSKNSYPRQILVELHPTNVTRVHAFFELLRYNNYVIFSKENNLYAGPYFFEYAFLKLNARFFQ